MDPYLCCLLGLCCPPAQQFEKLVGMRMKRGASRASAEEAVHFDLELVKSVRAAMMQEHA